jgi:flagellar M-ring protein FliF
MAFQNPFPPLFGVLSGLGTGRKIAFGLLAGGVLAALIALILWTGRPDFRPLYTGLSPEDAGAVLEQLRAENIPFRIGEGGTIRVPADRVFELTMTLAARGLPAGGGVGFEIFDGARLGMTEFEQNVHFQRALQGELGRTIRRFDEVEGCRVHIAMASRSLFLEQEEPATASVIVRTVPGRRLSKNQVRSIVHLLATSVQGLSPEGVTVVDADGTLLSGPESVGGADGEDGRLSLQRRMENALELRVRTLLDEVLGPNRSIVRVSAELDFTRQETTEERFDPETVPRSRQVSRTGGTGPAGLAAGVPGVLSNMTDTTAEKAAEMGPSAFTREEETINYEVGRMTRRTVAPVGRIRRLSVAVAVDGTWEAAEVPPEAAEGAPPAEPVYVARSDDELQTLTRLVERAVNFDPDRGDQVEVANLPFAPDVPAIEDEAPDAGWPLAIRPFLPLLKYLAAGFLVLLLFFVVVRPLVKWVTGAPPVDARLLQQLPMTVNELERRVDPAGLPAPAGTDLSRAVSGDREQALRLIRRWMAEE